MSDQPQALERSALERKDRSELMTIATAMGGKPGSRAKKADIIDVIFELAGIVPADEVPATDAAAELADAAPPADDATPAATTAGADDGSTADVDVDADGAASPRAGRAEGRSAGQRGGGEGGGRAPQGGSDQAESDRATAKGQANKGQANKDQANKDQANKDQANKDQANKGQANKGQASKGQANKGQGEQDQNQNQGQRGQGQRGQNQSQGQGGGNQSQGQDPNQRRGGPDDEAEDGDVESGNRRRRRRGRDRDRAQGDDAAAAEPVEVEGLLDLRDEGYGFLRVNGYLPSKDDVYVSVKQTRQFSLRKGDRIAGASRAASRNEKNPALLRVDTVNGLDPDAARGRPHFEDLTPLFPDEKLQLEAAGDPYNMTARIIDLVAPIGKGQRGMIVSPPKAGKTTIMKQIARSIEANHPDVHLIVLLVDERPEEVTDMRRSVQGEVAASTFDRPAEEHVQVAELTIERAKRLVESGRDVVVILDGITRLARAYNQAAPQNGRIMSGGLDAGAIYPPKKIFGAARNLEEGGSLTILATALVETGSRMDEVIFEEFKGTGNMELKLDRRLAERRTFPAIEVDASSTRHEELLFDNKQLNQVWKLRRVLSGMAADGQAGAGIELLTDRMRTFRTNDEFLAEIAKGATGA